MAKKKLKHLLSWLIDGSKVDGSIPTTMQDSLTIFEYLKLNEKINKMSVEQSISHIASLCERVVRFPENNIEERMIKTEVSSSITQQIGQLISKLDLEYHKILKCLIQPLNKLTLTEDYALDELVITLSQHI